MASSLEPKIVALKAAAAIAKGKAVKIGADDSHVAVASAGTDKILGILQNAPSAAEGVAEVAMPGGGAKALCGGTVAAGDLLTADADGKLIATTTANDKIIAQALQAGVANDLIDVNVVVGNY